MRNIIARTSVCLIRVLLSNLIKQTRFKIVCGSWNLGVDFAYGFGFVYVVIIAKWKLLTPENKLYLQNYNLCFILSNLN